MVAPTDIRKIHIFNYKILLFNMIFQIIKCPFKKNFFKGAIKNITVLEFRIPANPNRLVQEQVSELQL